LLDTVQLEVGQKLDQQVIGNGKTDLSRLMGGSFKYSRATNAKKKCKSWIE
jgi:hypothetical protein